MKIEDRSGKAMPEATITVDDHEIVDLLKGLADVIEGDRPHLHFAQVGGPQLVVRRVEEADPDPLGRQMDWWMGPLVLVGIVLLVIGAATIVRWAAGLI